MSKLTHMRADAAKNRERLIAAVRERFSAGDRTLSLGGGVNATFVKRGPVSAFSSVFAQL